MNELFRLTATERAAMGGRARDLVVERFTWSRVSGQMESVYEWMLGGGTKPAGLADA